MKTFLNFGQKQRTLAFADDLPMKFVGITIYFDAIIVLTNWNAENLMDLNVIKKCSDIYN